MANEIQPMNGSRRLSPNFRSSSSQPMGGGSGPGADNGPITAGHWPPHRGHAWRWPDWLRTFVLAQLAQCVVLSPGDGMVLLLSRHTEPGSCSVSSASPGASRDPSPLRAGVSGDQSEAVTLGPSVIRMELASGVFDARHADNTEVLLALLTQNKELEGKLEISPSQEFWINQGSILLIPTQWMEIILKAVLLEGWCQYKRIRHGRNLMT